MFIALGNSVNDRFVIEIERRRKIYNKAQLQQRVNKVQLTGKSAWF